MIGRNRSGRREKNEPDALIHTRILDLYHWLNVVQASVDKILVERIILDIVETYPGARLLDMLKCLLQRRPGTMGLDEGSEIRSRRSSGAKVPHISRYLQSFRQIH